MPSRSPILAGRRILVVEDEYMIADDLACELRAAGAEVIGPAASVPQAIRLIGHSDPIDAAVLDINLRETMAYPLIDRLIEADVHVLISSGYDDAMIPERYRHLPRCEKPISMLRLRIATERLWDTPVVAMPPPPQGSGGGGPNGVPSD